MSEQKLKVYRVLFFDSGVGGLSVYHEVKKINPNIESYYLFDNEAFPYGRKTEDYLIERIRNIIQQALNNFNPDLIVIACNTASTIALPTLRALTDVPIVGVVPAIKPAAAKSRKKIIGLLATPGTVKRVYTRKLIADFASNCKVLPVSSEHLAEIAENYITEHFIDKSALARELAPLTSLKEADQPDVLVLGCTHYPLVKAYIQELLPEIKLIDSGNAIGRRVASLLSRKIPRNTIVDIENRAYYTGVLKDYSAREKTFKENGYIFLKNFIIKNNKL
ncbi:MAG TPA: glutamate racemase [Succinivibrionaceae bacterium]|nr:glutamate racemase [Succinivibrionaceae bacterium]